MNATQSWFSDIPLVAKMFLGLFLGGFILMVALPSQRTTETELSAVVEDVRIIYKTTAEESKGSPIGGAIVGGLIAGNTGAIVGAISESSKPTQPPLTQISGCSFVGITPSSERVVKTYLSRYSNETKRCALLKKGDQLMLRRSDYRGDVSFTVLWSG
jgi:hypothetical protein